MAITSGLLRACALGALLLASSGAAIAQTLIVAEDATSAAGFQREVGRVVTFICPSTLNQYRQIWGTGTYLAASPICTAAVHAGVLANRTSTQVSIRMGTGPATLEGTTANGVTSERYQGADSTYSFVGNNELGQIDWRTNYDRVPDDFASPITVICPPNGNQDSIVVGTDVYRSDSAICVAAVHAGIITLATGGRVTVTLQPKQEAMVASERNGVLSRPWRDASYRSYPQPFSVTPGAVMVAAPASAPAIVFGPRQAPTSAPATVSRPTRGSAPRERGPLPATGSSNPSPRTIRLAGFTAAGSGPLIVPRTIATPGFVAVGTAPVIVPRTIRLSGWTGTGTAAN